MFKRKNFVQPFTASVLAAGILSTSYATAQTDTYNNVNRQDNSFNPQISLILDGQYISYKEKNIDEYKLPGFGLGGEAGLMPQGFSLGHTELVISSNIDDKFYGQFTFLMAEHDGERENQVEEAFIETIGLDYGLKVVAGRFLSSVGYLNKQHRHAWDFVDAPLVYQGIWGTKYIDDGVQLSWVAPTDTYIELGAEALAGSKFPAGSEANESVASKVVFANFGGDFNQSHSWQAGVSYYNNDEQVSTYGSHSHDDDTATETPTFTGKAETYGLNFIYKWAPNGNYKYNNFKLQAEYFNSNEDGTVTMVNSDPLEATTYEGKKTGAYIQAAYQFARVWRTSLRYDWLTSDNSALDAEVLEEAGMVSIATDPNKISTAIEYIPSEFSRVRLQYNVDNSYDQNDEQIILQYTTSIGAHGAHTF